MDDDGTFRDLREPPELPSHGLANLCPAEAVTDVFNGVSPSERQQWEAKIAKFHRAAGHPTNKNLARIVKDGGHPEWKVQVALNHRCPGCESLKQGGSSSGQVPPASTIPMYQAWEAITADAAEWVIPGSKRKMKIVIFMDMATKLRVVHPVSIYPVLDMQAEWSEDIIRGL